MVNRFTLKTLFDESALTTLVQDFSFRRLEREEIAYLLHQAFRDYILAALSEIGDDTEDKSRIYIEARHHLSQASKLLQGMPHPAGKMSYRLKGMIETLNKLVEGQSEFAASRAKRFMEKNLVRRLRDIWQLNTSTPFYAGGDSSGRNPRDYILFCFKAAAAQYPEIHWFSQVDETLADLLIKSIKR